MKGFILSLIFALTCVFSLNAQESSVTIYKAKDFSSLLGMPGFNDELLQMHFKLYNGYVKATNGLLGELQVLAKEGESTGPYYSGLKRMYGWEFNGMRLHELYFENLGGKYPLAMDSDLAQRMIEDFGNYANWKTDFIASGMMRGIGWVILYFDSHQDRLVNMWINEHDLGHLAGETPLLVMDVFEHAYMPQYGLDRKAYIKAFFDNIDWDIVEKRYSNALR